MDTKDKVYKFSGLPEPVTPKNLYASRRKFLKSLPILGGSVGITDEVSSIVDSSIRNRDRVRRTEAYIHTNHQEVVEKNAPPEREPVYYTIPYDKWVRVETADAASKAIKKRVDKVTDHPCVRVGVTKENKGQTKSHSVVVERSIFNYRDRIIKPDISSEELKDVVPDTASGEVSRDGKIVEVDKIPVKVRTRELQVADCSAANEKPKNYDCAYLKVPAGARFSAENPNVDGGFAHATLGVPAYSDWFGEYVMTTAGHIPGHSSGGDFYDRKDGHTAHQPTDDYSNFGWVYESRYEDADYSDDYEVEFDGAYIGLESDEDLSWGFAQDDGTITDDEEVAGSYAWDKIKDGGYLTKQGARTMRTGGKITEWWQNKTFEVEDGALRGDSGGPNFTETNYYEGTSYKSIAGICSYYIGTEDKGGYMHTGRIESYFDLTI